MCVKYVQSVKYVKYVKRELLVLAPAGNKHKGIGFCCNLLRLRYKEDLTLYCKEK